LGGDRGHGVDRELEERPPGDLGPELVRAEPARAAAGEDDAGGREGLGRKARAHGREESLSVVATIRPSASVASGWRGARGPGTWPSAVRRSSARRSRSSRIAITYLRLVPVASRYAAGVSGRSAAIAIARPARSRYV